LQREISCSNIRNGKTGKMGLLAYIYDSPLGNHSNGGISAKHKKVCIVNVDGPFQPTDDAPGVLLTQQQIGNLVCVPLSLEGKHTMFGGAYVCTSDSRFSSAVQKLCGYDHPFPVALHDRVE
jgi:hypothetical protein